METEHTRNQLPGLEALYGVDDDLVPGLAFRPTDPQEESYAQAVPTGLRQLVHEDVPGIEAQTEPIRKIVTDAPIIAVDAGVVNLGNTASGVVGALRGAAVIHHPDGRRELWTYRPGAFYLGEANRLDAFHRMGIALGKPDFYVKLEEGRPVEEKVRLGPHDHRLLDRARNLLERLIQKSIVEQFESAVIVLDGALTLRTFDTPQRFLRGVHEACQERDSTIIAVSKKTGLTIRGVDIRLLLDQEGGAPGRRKLTAALRGDRDRRDDGRRLGDLFVVRFAPGAETYRVDVAPAPGLMATEALDEFATSSRHRSGYPEPLVEAHAFSYMAPPIVAELQHNAIVNYQLDVKPEPNLGPVFAPFGGRYK